MNRIYTDYFIDIPMKYRISARLSSPYAIIHYCQENEAGALLPDRLLKTLGHREGIYPLEVPFRQRATSFIGRTIRQPA